MKKQLWILVPALALTGCGTAMEENAKQTAIPAGEMPESVQEVQQEKTETQPFSEEVTPILTERPDFDSITDGEVLQTLFSGEGNAERIEGQYYAPDFGEDYSICYIPEGAEPEAYFAELTNFTPERAQSYELEGAEQIADTELYTVIRLTYTENRVQHTELQLFPKNFRMSGNDYAYYTGGMDTESILQNFDLLAEQEKLLWRAYKDDPEIKCTAYEFYAVRLVDEQTAELGWYCYLIDRNDQLVNLIPEWNLKRSISLSSDLEQSDTPEEPEGEVLYDLTLAADKTEIQIDRDDSEVLFMAEPLPECTPETISLIDADTGKTVCELRDIADYENYGDTLQGDGQYHCRLEMDTDFGTEPDVSEERYYHYYAQFTDESGTHRSETIEIWVLEPFTDKELDDMETVDNAIEELMQTEDFRKGTVTERRELLRPVLADLQAQGLVQKFFAGEDSVSLVYACGISSAVMLWDFDEKLN